MWKSVSIAALVLALLACLWTYRMNSRHQETVEQALQRREAELVQRYIALIESIIEKDLEHKVDFIEPKTVEEALGMLSAAMKSHLQRREQQWRTERFSGVVHENLSVLQEHDEQGDASESGFAAQHAAAPEAAKPARPAARASIAQSAEDPDRPPSGVIAFVSHRNGTSDIYTHQLGRRGAVQITNDPGNDHSPSWSPDGQHIAFVSDRDGRQELYITDSKGENARRLTENDIEERSPAWSPDGRQLAFWASESRMNIYVINVDGGGAPQLITEGMMPRWSSNGRIVFTNATSPDAHGMYQVRLDGGEPERLIKEKDRTRSHVDIAPIPSPDGSKVLFASGTLDSQADRNSDLYILDVNSQTIMQLTDSSTFEFPMDWSPDGRHVLIWVSARAESRPGLPGTNELFVIKIADGALSQILRDDPTATMACWRPNLKPRPDR